MIALGGVADEQFALGIVVFQPILEGTAHEAAAYDSDVDHFLKFRVECCCKYVTQISRITRIISLAKRQAGYRSQLTMRFILSLKLLVLKFTKSPTRLSISFKYVSNCFAKTGFISSTDFSSTIT